MDVHAAGGTTFPCLLRASSSRMLCAHKGEGAEARTSMEPSEKVLPQSEAGGEEMLVGRSVLCAHPGVNTLLYWPCCGVEQAWDLAPSFLCCQGDAELISPWDRRWLMVHMGREGEESAKQKVSSHASFVPSKACFV